MSDNYTMGGDYGQMMKIKALEEKVKALEKHSHEPVDFDKLFERLERDIATIARTILQRNSPIPPQLKDADVIALLEMVGRGR